MRPLRLALLAVSLAAAGACASGPQVETDFDPKASFGSYNSFAMIRPRQLDAQANLLAADPLMHQRAEDAVRAELIRKGWREVAAEAEPGLLVAVHGSTKQELDVQSYGYTYGPWGPWGRYPSAAMMPQTTARTYDVGTLVVDMIDPRERKLVWRGTASGTVGSRERTAKAIPGAVAKVLAGFPPTPTPRT